MASLACRGSVLLENFKESSEHIRVAKLLLLIWVLHLEAHWDKPGTSAVYTEQSATALQTPGGAEDARNTCQELGDRGKEAAISSAVTVVVWPW